MNTSVPSEKWIEFIKKIRPFIDNENFYDAFVATLKPAKALGSVIYVVVESNLAFQTLIESYANKFNELAPSVFHENTSIKFVQNLLEIPEGHNLAPTRNVEVQKYSSHTKRNMVFTNFVVGSANTTAHDACIRIAHENDTSLAPVFIYGRTGLGKTHLANALANEYAKNFPQKQIIYVNSDDFTRNVVESLQSGKIEDLKKVFKQSDLLIVEDVQFLIGRPQTNEIFFSIFNHLMDNSKAVVFTSDKAPENLYELDARMISRFSSGLAVEVKRPDQQTLVKIIKIKLEEMEKRPVTLTEAAINKVVSLFNADVRKLEGIVKRILFFAVTQYAHLSVLDVAELDKILESEITMLNREVNRDPTILLEKVCREFNVSKSDVMSASRRKEFVRVRKICMYVFNKDLKMSLSDIGRFFSRDHSTVKSSIEGAEAAMAADQNLTAFVTSLANK